MRDTLFKRHENRLFHTQKRFPQSGNHLALFLDRVTIAAIALSAGSCYIIDNKIDDKETTMNEPDRLHDEFNVSLGGTIYTASPRILESINQHVKNGMKGGDFTESLLANDLRSTIFQADPYNRKNLYAYVAYLHTCVPSGAWGSTKQVAQWRAYVEGSRFARNCMGITFSAGSPGSMIADTKSAKPKPKGNV